MALSRYQEEVQAGTLRPDAEQASVMRRLDSISQELDLRGRWGQKTGARSTWSRWFAPVQSTRPLVKGLYLWGGVGRGKTHLCDLFFDALPFDDRRRMHFHHFMQRIHADLNSMGEVEDPLLKVADHWAAQMRLLLLDEIHVHDITDAMLLGRLMTRLLEQGVTLVTTSNVPPDDLYKDGLQRARFLPAIAQIRRHAKVMQMQGETDYRLQHLQTEPIYTLIQGDDDPAARQAMQEHFSRLGADAPHPDELLSVNGRDLPVLGRAGDLVWFDYDTLCNTPRSTHDYIELASTFETVMISNVPVLDDTRDDEARRFVNLIDEFYDRHVKVIMSAHAEPDALYAGKRLAFEFTRAASRLREMQSSGYLATKRLPPVSNAPFAAS